MHRLNREVDAIEERAEKRAAARAIAAIAAHHEASEKSRPGSGVPAHAACFFKDGSAWCCVRGDFINLQESPAGFGADMAEALDALAAAVRAA